MGKPDPNKLRDKAAALSSKGKHSKALAIYQELALLQPKDGSWQRKVAETHRHLGDEEAAAKAFYRSCETYAAQGFVIKAIATCKIILRLDPENREAKEKLLELNRERFGRSAEKVDATSPEGIAIPDDAGIGDIELAAVVAGSQRRHRESSGPSGIVDIPIDIDVGIEVDSVDEGANVEELLTKTPLFSSLSSDQLSSLIELVALVDLPAGQALFHEGDIGDTLYVISEGNVQVTSTKDGQRVLLTTLGPGEFFGEIALVTSQRRSATVEAVSDVELLAIERKTLMNMVSREASVLPILLRFLRERLIENLSAKSPLFAPFTGTQRDELVSRFKFVEVDSGTAVVEEGKVAPGLFVCLHGSLEVVREQDDAPLATLGSADVFGEMSLLVQGGAVASVIAKTKCILLEMAARDFRELIMTHSQVLEFVGELASQRESELAAMEGGEQEWEEIHLDLL